MDQTKKKKVYNMAMIKSNNSELYNQIKVHCHFKKQGKKMFSVTLDH